MKKKMLAFLMAVLIVVGMFPVTAMADEKVAKIGTTEYATLAEAVNAATEGQTVTLLKNASGDGIVVNKNLTIDLNTFTYTVAGNLVGSTGTTTNGFQLLANNTITIKNGKIAVGDNVVTGTVNSGNQNECRILIQNYSNLTLDGVTVDGTKCADSRNNRVPYVVSNNSGTTTIKDSTITAGTGAFAFDSYDSSDYTGVPTVTVENSTINGKIEVTGGNLEIESGSFTDLANAVKYAKDGATIELLDNVTLESPMDIDAVGKSIVLDLGTHTLTGRTNLKAGTLTIKNGTVVGGEEQALNVYGSNTETAENYSVLNIEADVNVTAKVYGVCLFGNTAGSNGYGAVINLKGTVTTEGDGKNGAVFVSGNLGKNVNKADSSNIIDITGKITSTKDSAVALNGLAVVNVKAGAELDGNTAVAVKRGTLNVNGGKIHSTGEVATPEAYYNGTEMTGAAISISSTYSEYGPLAVNISDGEILASGADTNAVYKYTSQKGGEDVAFTNAADISISGGIFSSKPNFDYLAEGYYAKEITEGTKWQVKPMEVVVKPAVVDETTGKVTIGTDEVTVEGAGEEGQPTKLEAAHAITNTLATEAVYAFENTKIENATEGLKITDLEGVTEGTTIEDKQVKVTLKKVEVEKFNENSATITRMEFDIKPVAVLNNGTEKDIPNNKIKAPITFRLPVDSNVTDTTVAVYHKGDVETEFKLMGTYPIQTVGTGSSTDKFIEVQSKEFSTFAYELLNANNATAEIDGDYYATLANAVEKASGKTITVLKDTNETVIVERAMSFKLVPGEGVTELGNIKPGDHYRRYIDGNKYTFRYYETGDTIVIGGNKNKDTKTETKEENPETGAPVMSMGALVVLAAAYVATRKH